MLLSKDSHIAVCFNGSDSYRILREGYLCRRNSALHHGPELGSSFGIQTQM